MLCQKCGKNIATTHIHSVVNGVVTELNLCNSCAENSGYGSLNKNSLVDVLFSMFGDEVTGSSPVARIKCKACGLSFSQVAGTGKVGCAECYDTFSSELLPYIKRVHGSTRHIGKKPNRAVMVVSKNDKLAEMRVRLAELVKNEQFEDAAVLRDEIKQAEEESGNE